eukprot:GHVP01070468.1.p1 GENE.GHVP01070468.1~~GHVP01070468.1.p1  ORF type:complete len:173 (+),score=10.52 GHVP01070468.1:72-521(+)
MKNYLTWIFALGALFCKAINALLKWTLATLCSIAYLLRIPLILLGLVSALEYLPGYFASLTQASHTLSKRELTLSLVCVCCFVAGTIYSLTFHPHACQASNNSNKKEVFYVSKKNKSKEVEMHGSLIRKYKPFFCRDVNLGRAGKSRTK